MEYRSSEVKAGFFIFLSLVGLIITVFMLGDIKNVFKPKKEIQIFFRFAGGLEMGAPVSYAGLQVGRVKEIELLSSHGEEGKDQISVKAEIDPKINLKKDSMAVIKTSGLMGGFYVDISPGSTVSPPLSKGEHLQGHESFEIAQVGDMMTEVVMQVRRFTDLTENLVQDSKRTLKLVQDSLKDVPEIVAENRKALKVNMRNLTQISTEMNKLLQENKGDVNKSIIHFSSVMEQADYFIAEKANYVSNIIDQVNRLSRELELLVADTRPELTNLVRNMDSGTRQIAASIDNVTGDLDKTLNQSSEVILENRRNLLLLVKNLRETSDNLKFLSGDLKRNPWKLVRKTDEEPLAAGDTKTALPLRKELRMKRLDKVSER